MLLLLIFLVVFILVILSLILNPAAVSNLSPSNVQPNNLKDYSNLKQKIVALNEPKLEGPYQNINNYLTILANKYNSVNDKYNALTKISEQFSLIYSQTNNPKYRTIFPVLTKFAKENFPKQYNFGDFYSICQDPTCADGPQPVEILAITNDLKKTDLAPQVQTSLKTDILNAGYISTREEKNGKQMQFDAYYNAVLTITQYKSTSSGNKQVLEELHNFLGKYYPNELKIAENKN